MQNVSVKFTAVETSVSEFLRWWTAAVVEMEKNAISHDDSS